MTTQADLLREIDAMANALMVPLGMADVGDWCSRSGARKVGVTVIVDRATQTIGIDGAISVGATEVELFESELGMRPDIDDTVQVGSTIYKLSAVVSRDENRHRFAVQERSCPA